jgi:hypothetical protein
MKKTALLILIAATICCCKKKANDCCAPGNDLANKWEIRKSVGGIAGTINYQPGNGYMLEFKDGNSFAYYDKGNIVQSGTYDLQPTTEIDKYRITFHTTARDLSQDAIFKGDTLVLLRFAPCCDIPDVTYVKVN